MMHVMSEVMRAAAAAVVMALTVSVPPAGAQAPPAPASPARPSAPQTPEGVQPPADYVIGPDDRLSILYWGDEKMSSDVVVRPDGMISLPLLNDVSAVGLTPEQLRAKVTEAALKFNDLANVQVIVREIRSRRVFITGMVASPAPYPLAGPTSVLQLISMAGGVQEYANKKNITIIRTENGQQRSFRFNYNDVQRGRNLQQNIMLKPGDTVVVP
jgi:polysaccharide export outer membrane protein